MSVIRLINRTLGRFSILRLMAALTLALAIVTLTALQRGTAYAGSETPLSISPEASRNIRAVGARIYRSFWTIGMGQKGAIRILASITTARSE